MSTDMWKKENTKECRVRLTKHSALFIALQSAMADKNITESQYIRMALMEKLQRDGYLQTGVFEKTE